MMLNVDKLKLFEIIIPLIYSTSLASLVYCIAANGTKVLGRTADKVSRRLGGAQNNVETNELTVVCNEWLMPPIATSIAIALPAFYHFIRHLPVVAGSIQFLPWVSHHLLIAS